MPICKICEKKFHACSSCHLNNEWEYEYCSEKCYGESDEYKTKQETIGKIKDMVAEFSDEQLVFLYRALSDGDISDALLDEITQILKD